jgi:hypothetical protein
MRDFIKSLGKVKFYDIDLSFRFEVLGYLLYCCYQLGFTGTLASEPMLFIGQDVVPVKVTHNVAVDDVVKYFTDNRLRSAYRKYMNDAISTDLKENPKRFWAAIKSKKQESTGVAPLKNKEGFIHSDTTSEAEILSEQFQSVYTKENTSTMPDKGQSKYPSMEDIAINTKGVFKLLKATPVDSCFLLLIAAQKRLGFSFRSVLIASFMYFL